MRKHRRVHTNTIDWKDLAFAMTYHWELRWGYLVFMGYVMWEVSEDA